MKVLLLAGGLGTRLRPLVSDVPKPMAPVGTKPFLEYQVERLRAQGFRELVFCVGHLAEHIHAYFGDGRRWGVRIDYAVEEHLLGTAGAIRNARDHIDSAFLVWNGDSYLEVDFQALVSTHRRHREADLRTIGTLAAARIEDADAYGALELDGDGRIRSFQEKRVSGPGWVSAGAYILEPTILDAIPGDRAVSLEKETFPTILEQGRVLVGHPVLGFFVDMGTPDGYHRFCQYAEEHLG